MHTLSPYWNAALHLGAGVAWNAAAAAVGGVDRLEAAGPDALLDFGLRPRHLASWRATGSGLSRGQPITLADPRYPPRLHELGLPPPVLLVEGEIEQLGRPGVAIVGTRRCTAHGEATARALGAAVAAAGWTVVSGLARGIDGAAHRGGLARTVAVLGHGLANTAPPSHRPLRARILDAGGTIVAISPDDMPPATWTFPARNAIVAALARTVVVVEAPERSGAKITARLAAELGRELWAGVGPPHGPTSTGCAQLLEEGATPLDDVDAAVSAMIGAAPPARPPWLVALFRGATLDEAAALRGDPDPVALHGWLARAEVDGTVVRLPGGRWAPSYRGLR